MKAYLLMAMHLTPPQKRQLRAEEKDMKKTTVKLLASLTVASGLLGLT